MGLGHEIRDITKQLSNDTLEDKEVISLLTCLWEITPACGSDYKAELSLKDLGDLFAVLIKLKIKTGTPLNLATHKSATFRKLINRLTNLVYDVVPFTEAPEENITAIANLFRIFSKFHISLDDYFLWQKERNSYTYSIMVEYLLAYVCKEIISKNIKPNLVLITYIFSALSRWNLDTNIVIWERYNLADIYNYFSALIIHAVTNKISQKDFLDNMVYLLNAIAQVDNFGRKIELLEKIEAYINTHISDISVDHAVGCLWSLLVIHEVKKIGEDPLKSELSKNLLAKIKPQQVSCTPTLVTQLSHLALFFNEIRLDKIFTENDLHEVLEKIKSSQSYQSKSEERFVEKLRQTIKNDLIQESYFDKASCHVIDVLIGKKTAGENDGNDHFIRGFYFVTERLSAHTLWRNKTLEKAGFNLVSVSKQNPFKTVIHEIRCLLASEKSQYTSTFFRTVEPVVKKKQKPIMSKVKKAEDFSVVPAKKRFDPQ